MFNKIIIFEIMVIFLIFLSCCSESLKTYPDEYQEALEVCKNNEGLNYLQDGEGSNIVICNNGARFNTRTHFQIMKNIHKEGSR